MNLKKRSKISFDKGGLWHDVEPTSINQSCRDDDTCHLHLNSLSSFGVGPITTVENAPGLILATGNEGPYLEESKADTYISVNGGLHFKKILNGSHIYQIGDQGGLIIAARDDKAVTSVMFSWDSGATWKNMDISERPVFVTNIVTDPENKGLHFQIYGVPEGETYGFVVPVNFENLMPRACKHYDENNLSGETDYEEWIPHTPGHKCINGEQVEYLRRKPDANCYNPDELDMVRQLKICSCSEEDWECDIGFEKDKLSQRCVPIDKSWVQKPPTSCDDYYIVKTGYRKVAGNVCSGGLNLGPHHMVCPEQHRKGMIYLTVAVVIVLLLVLRNRSAIQERIQKNRFLKEGARQYSNNFDEHDKIQ